MVNKFSKYKKGYSAEVDIMSDLHYPKGCTKEEFINPSKLYHNTLVVGEEGAVDAFNEFLVNETKIDGIELVELNFIDNNLKRCVSNIKYLRDSIKDLLISLGGEALKGDKAGDSISSTVNKIVVVRELDIIPPEIEKELKYIYSLSRSVGYSIFTIKNSDTKMNRFDEYHHAIYRLSRA